MQDAERAVYDQDIQALSEACSRGIDPPVLISLVNLILFLDFKDALHVLENWGAHANLVEEETNYRPLEMWHDDCASMDFSFSEELDGFGYDSVLRQGCMDLIDWGANPYKCQQIPLDEWCFEYYNKQFVVPVRNTVIAALKCLKPRVGKDIARYIGKYIWLNKREWHHWPKEKKSKSNIG